MKGRIWNGSECIMTDHIVSSYMASDALSGKWYIHLQMSDKRTIVLKSPSLPKDASAEECDLLHLSWVDRHL